MKRIVECVPNFSEGRDRAVIDAIVEAIRTAEADGERVQVLHVDAGEAANRTVVTFMGTAEAVCEAAFRGVQTAGELIDMRHQHGTHPRIGATDVLPLVPLSGITLEECATLARRLAERIYRELGIPCYCYEAAAFTPERRNLAVCRAGEYESLPAKMDDPLRRPDFGPTHYDERTARTGATVVGARDLLIAVNFNLAASDGDYQTDRLQTSDNSKDCQTSDSQTADNTPASELQDGHSSASLKSLPVRQSIEKMTSLAQEIACDVREKGRKVDGTWVRGTLKGCKAIGWYIEEYGIAQVSMNITDIHATPLHKAYEEVCRAAAARGARITGTEIIGLVPRSVLVEAGRYFKDCQTSDSQTADECLEKGSKTKVLSDSLNSLKVCQSKKDSVFMDLAIRSMHLDDLRPFNIDEKTLPI